MKKKVLFTGNGKLLVDDLIAHMPPAYQCFKCYPSEMKLMEALEKYSPNAIVVGLSKETGPMLHMYSVLKDKREYAHLPIIAIGSQLDCDIFYKNVFQRNIKMFVRPVDVDKFMNTLDSVIEGSLKEETEVRLSIENDNEKKAVNTAKAIVHEKKEKHLETLIRRVEILNDKRGQKTILVVDDDIQMLNLIKLYLSDLYEVVVVPSGKLALKYLNQKHADLVLLDYMMPGEDGPTVLRKIREDTNCPDIPVIFLTGVSEKDKVLIGLELKPEGYLLKPVKREVLLEKVMEVLLGLN